MFSRTPPTEDQTVLSQPKILLTFAVAAALTGCSPSPKSLDQVPEFNVWLASGMQDTAIRNAIIAQHTIFPYHFEVDSDRLNELGTLDLAVLAGHYLDRSGELSIRRGDASKELYDARVARVRALLERAGVAPERIKITDALAGGEGMPSQDVVRILEDEREGRTGKSSSKKSGSGQERGESGSMSGSGSGQKSGSSTGSRSTTGSGQYK
jgi:hypothetical protein